MDPPASVDLSKIELDDTASETSEVASSQTAEEKEKAKAAKKAAKAKEKAEKEAAKAARAAQRGKKSESVSQADPDDPLKDQYGDTELVQSAHVSGRTWTDVSQVNGALVDHKVVLRARVHAVRGKGKSCFLVLRQRTATIQAVLFVDDKTVSKGMVNYAMKIPRESIVDVEGVAISPENPVESCSQCDVELSVTSIKCVSRSAVLPFQVIDAARSEAEIKALEDKGEKVVRVNQDTRLDDRYLDIRTPANQAIFKVQSAVCQLFREILLSEGFIEIHTPKLISGTSEGGAAVFRIDYMGRPGCLAQSPQLYKQMAICGDFERVFEIGPVFRAENSNTHRHLCEFMGLDLEMAIHEHYDEVLDVINKMFVYIFEGLRNKFGKELEVIAAQYPAEPLRWQQNNPRIEFAEGIKWLQEAGYDVDPFGDLKTEQERALGKIVKEKFDTDFYILHRYPLAVRPFYTMPCKDDDRYSNSFDIFIRGEEIISGAQRVHDPVLLEERAKLHDIPVDSIQAYIDSFKYGAPPHGGCGVGLERVVMLFCGLDNIRKTSLFPRDPNRLTP